ncbi:extracellular transglutaminase [Strongylocentrotus purpuratus]|uniref:Extracellular transglutaminase n=1 Tax=Strongylocentrotus purpuratus TaxID=7668 RepID=C4P258_STRPU|nr:transglutaminase 1 [Strongylocentrotus purpuratus]ACQ66511.1 extracellular transglutaminase [Strongylocentrotus purpuratus]|eukprot:NP_001154909.1 extracellular transglutaminase [Strongylocentrotus purpuratus]
MVRRSTRTSRTPSRFGYSARYEPYTVRKASVLVPAAGRRNVPTQPLVIEKAKETVKQLKVTAVDLCSEANKKAHHTDAYEVDQLILRRGQVMDMCVTFDRAYSSAKDTLSLELLMGSRPSVASGSRVPIDLVTRAPPPDDFGLQVVSSSGNKVTMKVHLACDALVGEYQLVVCTAQTKEEDEYRYECEDDIIILFNPWCKKDDVYMENDKWRKEYVMNENGAYFYGTASNIGSSAWYQGQFEEVALECALYLLKKSRMTSRHRSSPVEICRVLSALVNSQDDDGVLVGNWSGDYSDGVEPTAWNGSISILSQYMKTETPVEYGQCWVFGSLLTTLCRTLGIPCRTITNFESAHDSDANLTLDYHFNEEGDPLEDLNDDSIWNFHVWNDVWFARPDLPEGYGGWQALDSTPQETSHGEFRMGPASLKAIKQGHVYLDYDTKFAFSEVNAETVYWTVPKNARHAPQVITTDPKGVGNHISTKAVLAESRQDITEEYKYKEGSSLERIAVYNASRYVAKNKNFRKDIKQDVEFEVVLADGTMIGKDFSVKVIATNKSSTTRSGSVTLTGSTVFYTGVRKTRVYSSRRTFSMRAGESETETFTVEAADYIPELTEYAGFTFFIMSSVTQTKQVFSIQKDFVLNKPTLELSITEDLMVGQPMRLSVTFTNPLDKAIRNGVFRIEGPDIDGFKADKFRVIQPNEKVTHVVRIVPKRTGNRRFFANFSSDILIALKGSSTFVVGPSA